MAAVGRELRVSVLALRAQEARRYYVQLAIAGPSGVALPPPPAGAAPAEPPLRPDTVARTETAPAGRTPEFRNRTFVMRLPQPLGAALHSRAVVQVSLYAPPSLDAPPGPLVAGKEADDLVGRGYVEVRGEVASRLLRGERVTVPVRLLDLGRDACAAVAATGTSRIRRSAAVTCSDAAEAAGGMRLGGRKSPLPSDVVCGATELLLAARCGCSGSGGARAAAAAAPGVYGKSDLEALIELTLLDCIAADGPALGLPVASVGGANAGSPAAEPPPTPAGTLSRSASLATGGSGAAECCLLVVVSAARRLPLVKGAEGRTVAPSCYVAAKSQRDVDQKLPAQAVTSTAAATQDPVWSQLLRVTYLEGSLAKERLLLAVVQDDTARLLARASVPLGAVVPGIHYNLELQFPDLPGASLFVSLCLTSAPRAQLRHLRASPLAAAPWRRVLEARLAGTSAPLGAGDSSKAVAEGSELWAVWRPAPVQDDLGGEQTTPADNGTAQTAALAGPAAKPAGAVAAAQAAAETKASPAPTAAQAGAVAPLLPLNASALHTPVPAMDESAMDAALRRATTGLLGGRSSGSSTQPGEKEEPQQAPCFQALPVQRLQGSSGGGGAEGAGEESSLLWPADHMAVLPLGSGSSSDSAAEPGDGAVLELMQVWYGTTEASSVKPEAAGKPAAAPPAPQRSSFFSSKGRAAAALTAARQAAATKGQPPAAEPPSPQQQQQARCGASGRPLARAELRGDALDFTRPGEPALLDALPLSAPDGRAVGFATAEAIPWEARALLRHLRAAAGGEAPVATGTAIAGRPRDWPEDFCRPGVLPATGVAPVAYGGGGTAALLLRTLSKDMVAKQAALERLQRQLDASEARCEAAAGRLRDLSGRNNALADEAARLRQIIREEEQTARNPGNGSNGAGTGGGGEEGGGNGGGVDGVAAAAWVSPLGVEPATLSKEELLQRADATVAALRRERRRNAELVHRLQQLHCEQIDVSELHRRYSVLQDAHMALAEQLTDHETLRADARLLRDTVQSQEGVIGKLERLLAAAAGRAREADEWHDAAATAEAEAARLREELDRLIAEHPEEQLAALSAQLQDQARRAAEAEAEAAAVQREAEEQVAAVQQAAQALMASVQQAAEAEVAVARREAEAAIAADRDRAAAAAAAEAARTDAERAFEALHQEAETAVANAHAQADAAVADARAAAAAEIQAVRAEAAAAIADAKREAEAAVAADRESTAAGAAAVRSQFEADLRQVREEAEATVAALQSQLEAVRSAAEAARAQAEETAAAAKAAAAAEISETQRSSDAAVAAAREQADAAQQGAVQARAAAEEAVAAAERNAELPVAAAREQANAAIAVTRMDAEESAAAERAAAAAVLENARAEAEAARRAAESAEATRRAEVEAAIAAAKAATEGALTAARVDSSSALQKARDEANAAAAAARTAFEEAVAAAKANAEAEAAAVRAAAEASRTELEAAATRAKAEADATRADLTATLEAARADAETAKAAAEAARAEAAAARTESEAARRQLAEELDAARARGAAALSDAERRGAADRDALRRELEGMRRRLETEKEAARQRQRLGRCAAQPQLEAEIATLRRDLEAAREAARSEAAAAAALRAAGAADAPAAAAAAARERERERVAAALRAERAEATAAAAQIELVDVTKRYAREIAELKTRLAERDAQLAGGFGPLATLYGGDGLPSLGAAPSPWVAAAAGAGGGAWGSPLMGGGGLPALAPAYSGRVAAAAAAPGQQLRGRTLSFGATAGAGVAAPLSPGQAGRSPPPAGAAAAVRSASSADGPRGERLPRALSGAGSNGGTPGAAAVVGPAAPAGPLSPAASLKGVRSGGLTGAGTQSMRSSGVVGAATAALRSTPW